MKAKILLTGEIVDVCRVGNTDVYMETKTGRNFYEYELEFLTEELLDKQKHWEDVRERAAIAAMQGTITILSNSDRYAFSEIVVDGFGGHEKTYPNEIAEFAIACADGLVKKLKGE